MTDGASLKSCTFRWMLAIVAAAGVPAASAAADLEIVLPLGRTAYQTNEWIDVSVVRRSGQGLSAGDLVLRALGKDGSKLAFTFPVPDVAAQGPEARATEHLHLDGRLLRPGHYTIEAAADGATTKTELDVYSHLRKTSYRLINWGRAQGADQLVEGEDGLGFNLFYGGYAADDQANFIRAGVDFMSCCTMGGGHQMDLRQECDWSDPYVSRGGTWRVVRRAFIDRTRPNAIGIHFYDEPGLTWWKHAATGEWTPHGIPSQVRSFRSAFGKDPIPYDRVDPNNPDHVAQWRHWALWKLGFMDAAWKEAQFGVSYVRPDYLSVTQTQYGFTALADGIYFNAARCLPVVSGHGGYDDYGLGYFNPSYTLEMGRARDFAKAAWYLPTWYGNTPSDRFRLEQYLSFMTNIQGMITPPDIDPFQPATRPAAEGVVECNKTMARLGTIFTTMPVTRPPVAMLYSMSQNIREQTRDRKINYAHDTTQGKRLLFTYMAGKVLQHQFLPVVEEDIVDGTLAAHHKAVIITSVDELDPKVVAALEGFAARGGLVLLTGDCGVKIRGSVNLGVTPDFPDADIVRRLHKEQKYAEANKYTTVGKYVQGAMPLAKAIQAQLDRVGIKPILMSDQPGIAVTRQAAGDIEYIFAVNATYDNAAGGWNTIRPAEATLGLAADGRPVYDAVRGGPVPELKVEGSVLAGKFRFGPGQMRVFCRTARPIGKVQALTPMVLSDYTKAEEPLRVEVGAVLADGQGRVLSGSAPLRVRLIDPLGSVRYDLYRATSIGSLRLTLPLAASDPPGTWKVVVGELLNNTEDTASFTLAAPAQCDAMAGKTPRAVSLAGDRDNVFRFFRVHHDVTIAVGSSQYNQAAAQRLAESLRPWGVRSTIVKAADVNHPRPISPEEAPTWIGLEPGRVKPGPDNPIAHAGYDMRGPVVLLGTAEDNPLIQYIQKQRYLPYPPDAQRFPGRGRGMFAWQRDAIGPGQESIALVAYDAAGMGEAVGSLYEAAAGLEPLCRWMPPASTSIAPAAETARSPEAATVWQVSLPDRPIAMKAVSPGQLSVLTWDGSLVRLDAGGRIASQEPVAVADMQRRAEELKSAADAKALELAKKAAPAGRIVKHVAVQDGRVAVAYWGGTLQVLTSTGQVQTQQLMPHDVAGLAWVGGRLAVGLSSGQVFLLMLR